MAKHRLTRAPKINYARAALGVTVAVAAFGAHTSAHADTPSEPQAILKQAASPTKKLVAAKADAGKPEVLKHKPSAGQILALATQQIGTKEDSRGGGTKFQKWYMDSPRALETIKRDGGSKDQYLNAAWCAMFVSWVGEQTGARTTVGWDAYTVTYAKWFKNNQRWGATAKPGAVVYFSWSGSKSLDAIDHVGFVVKDNGNGTITTVEGNTGNGVVEERTRPKSQVVGYGYPDYGA